MKIKPEQVKVPKTAAEDEAAVDLDAVKIQSKILILGLPVPPIFRKIPESLYVAWVQDGFLTIYYDYTSSLPKDREAVLKNNPIRMALSAINSVAIVGNPEATAISWHDHGALKQMSFPASAFSVFTELIPSLSAEPLPKKEAVPEVPKSEAPLPPVDPTSSRAQNGRFQPAPHPATPKIDLEFRLNRLEQLHSKHLISVEEYAKKRAEILEKF